MKIRIDTSDLRRVSRELEKIRAKLPQAIAQGLNEGGDRVRTGVRRALQKQTGLKKYASVTERMRTARAFTAQGDLTTAVQGSAVGQGMQYQIIVTGKPTRPEEFRWTVKKGPGGGVQVWFWGRPHPFPRSFQTVSKKLLMMRLGKERLPIRGFDGPNLARESTKGQTAEAFYRGVGQFVAPAIEKRIIRALK